jgi:thiol-disulfide isomerase/thioredoxin
LLFSVIMAAVILMLTFFGMVTSPARALLVALAGLLAGGIVYWRYEIQEAKFPVKAPGAPSRARYAGAIVLASIVVAVFFFAAMSLAMQRLRSNTFPEPSRVGSSGDAQLPVLGQADPNWVLRTLDGKEMKWDALSGKVVFLNFWATWCGPCVGELPSIQSLADAMGSEDVAFVLVSAENPATVRTFAQQHQLRLPLYHSPGPVPSVYGSNAIPITFIINRRGEIVYKHLGGKDWDSDSCKRFLRALL